ncbi:sulfotransferase domain-containing protein [Pseudomonas sp. N040]|nr:sulfotransferase domain-containing protein [Pseudomonas sp. N040]
MKMDFMVPGISKCGTTTLCYLLGEHPQIFVPAFKEPHHFIRADLESDAEAYRALFAAATPEQLCGEGSQMYATPQFEELVSTRLQQNNPQMKLIFCVRNPLKRIESSYREFHHSGAKYAVNAPFGISQAIAGLPALLQDSHYWQRLQPFRQRFGDGQILVVFLEDLQRDAQHELARCYRFLGVDATFQNPSAGTRLNSQEEKRYDTRLLRFLRTNPHTGFKLAKIPLPMQERFFTAVGMRPRFRGALDWEPGSREYVVQTLRDDIQRLLAYCNKAADYWPEFA